MDTVVLPTATLFDPLGPSIAWWGTAAPLLAAAAWLAERRPKSSLPLGHAVGTAAQRMALASYGLPVPAIGRRQGRQRVRRAYTGLHCLSRVRLYAFRSRGGREDASPARAPHAPGRPPPKGRRDDLGG